jgi:hypothetical protein
MVLGMPFGAALDNVGLGLAVGLALGLAYEAMTGFKSPEDEDGDSDDEGADPSDQNDRAAR